MRHRRPDPINPELGSWPVRVTEAACTFEARWTMRTLRRVDPDLALRLGQQRVLFDTACITGTAAEVELHGAAMVRGYAVVVRALEASEEPDDAYLLGQDPSTGLRVAVGHQRASAAHLGATTIWVTPDEVATLLAASEQARLIAGVKAQFPGAELVSCGEGQE